MKKFVVSAVLAIGMFGGLAISQSAMAGCYCPAGVYLDLGGNLCGVPNPSGSGMQALFEKVCTADAGSSRYTPTPAPDPTILRGQSDTAVALSPSTGAVGIASYSWSDVQYNQTMMAGISEFALASCINKTNQLNTQSYNFDIANNIIKKYGGKSDCQVVKKTKTLGENLIAILRGKKSNGQYVLYWITRDNSSYLFSQKQPEFKQLMAKCQAEATNCEIVGQYGNKTELE